MKKEIINTKTKVLLALLFFLPTIIFANINNYVLEDDNIIDARVTTKINEIGQETYLKTGVQIFVYVKNKFVSKPIKSKKEKFEVITKFENKITNNLKDKFIVITMSVFHTHVNLLMSNDLKSIIDKDDILDDYIVPLLASKDKNSVSAKVSAAILNGYSEIVKQVAKEYDVKIESNIEGSGDTFGAIWKVFMYTIVISGLLVYGFAVYRSKRA